MEKNRKKEITKAMQGRRKNLIDYRENEAWAAMFDQVRSHTAPAEDRPEDFGRMAVGLADKYAGLCSRLRGTGCKFITLAESWLKIDDAELKRQVLPIVEERIAAAHALDMELLGYMKEACKE